MEDEVGEEAHDHGEENGDMVNGDDDEKEISGLDMDVQYYYKDEHKKKHPNDVLTD